MNLDKVQVGDHLKIGCTEELMVIVNKSGETPGSAGIDAVKAKIAEARAAQAK